MGVLGDIDGDLVGDVAGYDSYAGEIGVWSNTAEPAEDRRLGGIPYPPASGGYLTVAWVDADQLAAWRWGTGVYLLDLAGTFPADLSDGDLVVTGVAGSYFYASTTVGIGDSDADGVAELAFAAAGSGLYIIPSDPSGTTVLADVQQAHLGVAYAYAVAAAGDVDGDGHDDLAWTSYRATAGVQLGPFEGEIADDKVSFAASSNTATAVTVCEVDGERLLAVADTYYSQVHLYDVVDRGRETPATATYTLDFTTGAVVYDIACADFDQDGADDIAIPKYETGTIPITFGPLSAPSDRELTISDHYAIPFHAVDSDANGSVELYVGEYCSFAMLRYDLDDL